MTNYRRVILFIVSLLVIAPLVVGCTTEVDFTMGEEFVPAEQKMEMRHRVYKGGEMSENGTVSELPLSIARLYQTDSIPSANMTNAYFGRERSDIYGVRTAGFMTQMLFGMTLDEERGWGYRPIFDSMAMGLYITDFHGDTTYKQRFEVYEITSNDYFKLPKDEDTTFYLNFDPTPYISKEPVFEFTFPNQDKGVYVGNIENPAECSVLLEETPATQQYIERLMLLTSLDDNGGYALDNDELYTVGNEEYFVEQVRGIYIKPAEDSSSEQGAVFATNLEKSYMLLFSRGRYEEDPAIIRDTTYMSYNFYVDPANNDVKAGNVSINTVSHDYSGVTAFDPAQLDTTSAVQRKEVLTGYVDAMGGVVTEVIFTDELIQSLADIVLSKEGAVVSVNQAQLTIYLEGSEYDYTAIDPIFITPLMDDAMTRLGLYTDYGDLIAVSDYAYLSENAGTSLAYGGELNRSLACYTMDISAYVQSLMMAAANNLLDDGKTVNMDKFKVGNVPDDQGLGMFRRFYVAPAADALFGFNRQAIVGGDGEVDGVESSAPITLELTYTIVY